MKHIQREKLAKPVWVEKGDAINVDFYNGEERVGRLYHHSTKQRNITEIIAFELDGDDIEGIKWGFGGAFLEVED